MNYEIPIPADSRKISRDDNKNTNKKTGYTRRDLLKLAAASGAAALFGVSIFETTKKKNEPEETIDDLRAELEREGFVQLREDLLKESAREVMEKEEGDVIGETFREQLEKGPRINLDKNTREAIFQKWYKKYSPGTINYKEGILGGIGRMYSWQKDIKEIFEKYEVPEKFIYLAIAESHFRLGDVSKKGAVGPYQITKSTAALEKFKISVDDDYDERLDPVRSAELCAAHLRYSYERLGKNWNLALLDYNGGFTDAYLKYLPKEELSMPLKKIHAQGNYILKEGETLSKVAQKFETSLPLLSRLNPLPVENYQEWFSACEKMQPGKKLTIPQKREINEEAFYNWMEEEINKVIKETVSSDSYKNEKDEFKIDYLLHILSGYKENINYPGKFHAILKVIQENKIEATKGKFQMKFSKARLNRKATLIEIATLKKISLENLILANPAIKNPEVELKKGSELRFPEIFYIQADKNKRKIII